MKCTNRFRKIAYILILSLSLSLINCGNLKYDMHYDSNSQLSGFDVLVLDNDNKALPFANDLCVVKGNVKVNSVDLSKAYAGVLFDLNKKEVKYSKEAHTRLNPASLTKVMTALVALEYGTLDKVLTATENVGITESGAQLIGLKAGDTMTLEQALHILLLYSANDVAVMIAENVGGTMGNFIDMMNEEAVRIGATNTHFENPHGLTSEEHYTTAYDLYLILNEAIKYDKFIEIVNSSSYQTSFYDRDGNPKDVSFETTNRYLKGTYPIPDNVNVIGGKTGTTSAAGHCLMLLSRDVSGAPYISVILHSEDSDTLYQEMSGLLEQINK